MTKLNLWKELLESARVAFESDQLDEGEEFLLRAIAAASDAGANDDKFVSCVVQTTHTFYDRRHYRDGERVCARVLKVVEQASGANDLRTAQVLFDLGNFQSLSERHAEAAISLKRSLDIRRAVLGEHAQIVQGTFGLLSMSLHHLGNAAWEEYFASRTMVQAS